MQAARPSLPKAPTLPPSPAASPAPSSASSVSSTHVTCSFMRLGSSAGLLSWKWVTSLGEVGLGLGLEAGVPRE
jgi:hypothetical protein